MLHSLALEWSVRFYFHDIFTAGGDCADLWYNVWFNALAKCHNKLILHKKNPTWVPLRGFYGEKCLINVTDQLRISWLMGLVGLVCMFLLLWDANYKGGVEEKVPSLRTQTSNGLRVPFLLYGTQRRGAHISARWIQHRSWKCIFFSCFFCWFFVSIHT